jgi:hypothetical protein
MVISIIPHRHRKATKIVDTKYTKTPLEECATWQKLPEGLIDIISDGTGTFRNGCRFPLRLGEFRRSPIQDPRPD